VRLMRGENRLVIEKGRNYKSEKLMGSEIEY
jgi:hypothetical protein